MSAPTAAESSRLDALLDFDGRHLWHPYAGPAGGPPSRLVVSAEGVRLRLAGGTEVVDGMSSWWAAIHGYRHPALDAALAAQAGRMSHVMFGGLTHAPAIELGRRLLELTGLRDGHVFFADSGSVSVEVAVKMCLQYQRGLGRPERRRFLTVRGGYHGDTFAAMSLCDPDGGMHALWTGTLAEQVFADRPPAGYRPDADEASDPELAAWAAGVRALAARHAGELAGIVVEPVLQGAGGMHVYPPACLRVLRELADEHGLLLVLDEIATGFGRTGRMFGADHAGVRADLVCLGKALTGGYLTLAAVVCAPPVAAGIAAGEPDVLMHGPTFMANPLACAVANANLELLAGGDWAGRVARISAGLRAGLGELAGRPAVADVRVLGAVGVVQLDRPVDVPAATAAALARGVWLRPFRDLIYTMPPYLCGPEEVATICAGVAAATEAGTR